MPTYNPALQKGRRATDLVLGQGLQRMRQPLLVLAGPRQGQALALSDADAPDLDLDPADLSSDPFYVDELAHDPLAFTSASGARSLTAVLPPAWDQLADDFGQVTLPVLFVHGSDDPVVPAAHTREWAARLKRARLAEFPGGRHDILNETVHCNVAAAITEFVLTAC